MYSSETSNNFCRTTKNYIPQDSALHSHRFEYLKFYSDISKFILNSENWLWLYKYCQGHYCDPSYEKMKAIEEYYILRIFSSNMCMWGHQAGVDAYCTFVGLWCRNTSRYVSICQRHTELRCVAVIRYTRILWVIDCNLSRDTGKLEQIFLGFTQAI
jgi:hypothetical protein